MHECPECGQVCDCQGDIDDCVCGDGPPNGRPCACRCWEDEDIEDDWDGEDEYEDNEGDWDDDPNLDDDYYTEAELLVEHEQALQDDGEWEKQKWLNKTDAAQSRS